MIRENEKYTASGVIERGYKIYDEWKNNKYKSKKIVSSVSLAVSSMNEKNSAGARMEALSCLFALDLRIKERYKTIFRCIIFFFAYRREAKALEWLKAQLDLSSYSGDIHTLIEIELEKIRKIAELEELDAKDNRKKGGRARAVLEDEASAGVAQDEASLEAKEEKKITSAKEKQKEDDEAAEEKEGKIIVDEEKKSEEKEAPINQALEVNASPRTEKIAIDKEALFRALNENQQKSNVKEENSGYENKHEPIENKSSKNQETDPYVDVFPLFYEENGAKKEEKVSFIDDVMMDNLVMGKRDFVTSGVEGEAGVQKNISNESQASSADSVPGGANGREAHLYDKMVLDMKNSQGHQSRESIKIDMSLDAEKENEFRKEMNFHIPEDNIIAYKDAGSAEMKHRLDVYCEEHGIKAVNDPNEEHGVNNQADKNIVSGIK